MSVPLAAPSIAGKPRRIQEVPQIMKQGWLTPWLYLAPALIVMTTFIIYPTLNTIYLSVRNINGTDWATAACEAGQQCWGLLENFRYALTSPVMQIAFFNNIVWILLMVTSCVVLGLLIALLANRVRYESVAKSIIFLPMAISFVGAGVIWKFIYNYNPSGQQIGLLNAVVVALGGHAVSWLTTPQVSTIALIVVGVWMSTGFCMTITSAAIKNVPQDILEAARVDGANAWQTFWSVILPTIMPTLTVVTTTMVINVLKIFDIVYVMTGGLYNTDVIATRMYQEQYNNFNTGRAAAIAVVLIIVVLPAMYMNLRRFINEERGR
ncbi:MAG TPA: sugar ABC transporter permease [Aggregatilineales bacterium]|nr:sugar ABC transporter permease [Aggregatilineales bacterium]